jgi:hypothetical protein
MNLSIPKGYRDNKKIPFELYNLPPHHRYKQEQSGRGREEMRDVQTAALKDQTGAAYSQSAHRAAGLRAVAYLAAVLPFFLCLYSHGCILN